MGTPRWRNITQWLGAQTLCSYEEWNTPSLAGLPLYPTPQKISLCFEIGGYHTQCYRGLSVPQSVRNGPWLDSLGEVVNLKKWGAWQMDSVTGGKVYP